MGLLDNLNIFKPKEQQPQQQGNPQNYSIMPPIERSPLDASVHIWALNSNDDSLVNFLMQQQGNYFDKIKNKWIPIQEGKLGFNNTALIEIHKILSSVSNKSNALGWIDDTQLKTTMRYTLRTLIKSMTINKKRWELKDWARDSLYRNCENILFLFLTKLLNGHTANLHFSGGGVSESITHQDSFDKSNNGGLFK